MENFEGTLKIVGGNYSKFTPELDNKTSPEYKQLAKEFIATVRTGLPLGTITEQEILIKSFERRYHSAKIISSSPNRRPVGRSTTGLRETRGNLGCI